MESRVSVKRKEIRFERNTWKKNEENHFYKNVEG